MTETTTTLTLRLPPALKADLSRLAGETHRSKSYLAAQAIRDYVAAELEIINGIKQGLEDCRAGRVISHEEFMKSLAERYNLGS